ncbi:MAG TPA: hypothetical protein PLH94_13320 [Fimbriimonadaceae bacterium]|nr:hypothetical protein [Fimbriimonadaceae bacterium]
MNLALITGVLFALSPVQTPDVAVVSQSSALVGRVTAEAQTGTPAEVAQRLNTSPNLVASVENGALIVLDMETGALRRVRQQSDVLRAFMTLADDRFGTTRFGDLTERDRGAVGRWLAGYLALPNLDRAEGTIGLFAYPYVTIEKGGRSETLSLSHDSPWDAQQAAILRSSPLVYPKPAPTTASPGDPGTQFTTTVLNTTMTKRQLYAIAAKRVDEQLEVEAKVSRELAAQYLERVLAKVGGLSAAKLGRTTASELSEPLRSRLESMLIGSPTFGFENAAAAVDFLRSSDRITVGYTLAVGFYDTIQSSPPAINLFVLTRFVP